MIMLNAFKQSPPICNVKDPKSVLEVLNFDPTHYQTGVNILAWNHKLFPKGIFQDKKLFPRIYFPNLIIALHL